MWTRLDLGTLREELLFVTDYDYNLLDIDILEIVLTDEDGNEEIPGTVELERTMKQIENQEISF